MSLNKNSMSGQPRIDLDKSVNYEIRVGSSLSAQYTDWFDGMSITVQENNETLIAGLVIDQAALYGVLKKVRDFGLQLISVIPAEP